MKAVHETRHLVVENVPAHRCTYACRLCGFQPGPAPSVRRAEFYDDPEAEVERVGRRLEALHRAGTSVDLIAIRPSGEATLDRHLGALLSGLRRFGVPLLVYTNGSTVNRDDVRQELAAADAVCIELSTLEEAAWRRIHHPAATHLDVVLNGLRVFSSSFKKTVFTTTHLQEGVNTDCAGLEATADFAATLKPIASYLHFAPATSDEQRARAAQLFAERVKRVVSGEPEGERVGRVVLSRETRVKKATLAAAAAVVA